MKVDVSSDEEGGYDPYKQQKDFKPSPKKAVSPKKAAPAPSPKKSPAKKATAVKSNEVHPHCLHSCRDLNLILIIEAAAAV